MKSAFQLCISSIYGHSGRQNISPQLSILNKKVRELPIKCQNVLRKALRNQYKQAFKPKLSNFGNICLRTAALTPQCCLMCKFRKNIFKPMRYQKYVTQLKPNPAFSSAFLLSFFFYFSITKKLLDLMLSQRNSYFHFKYPSCFTSVYLISAFSVFRLNVHLTNTQTIQSAAIITCASDLLHTLMCVSVHIYYFLHTQ